MTDWRPQQYLKFKNERTQPSIDLAARIDVASPARVIDIGCGPGNSTAVLRARWGEAEIVGMDSSDAMLATARASGLNASWVKRDTASDLSDLGRFDVVFSNAALQWMPRHEVLIPKLFSLLECGGVFAAQVPYVRSSPVYALLLEMIAEPKWADFIPEPPKYPRHFTYDHFYNIICQLGSSREIWQTEYIHVMESHNDILEWYRGSGLRVFLDYLPDRPTKDDFCADYLERLSLAYRREGDGKILLPFTRIFFTVKN